MKNVILLVDVENSHFLIVNKNNQWSLPTINRIDDIKCIKEKIYKKYKINIKEKVNIIEETEKYFFVKCAIDDKKYNQILFKDGVINEIYDLISNKLHKQLLFNLSIKIGLEMINDSFWLGVILTAVEKIDDIMTKSLISDFLLQFSSSFCEELITYKFGKVVDQKLISNKELKELRNNYFKLCPLYDSKHMKSIINEMEIDFNSSDFDIVLFYNNGELIDINIRTWKNKNINFDLCNGIVLSPRRWIKNFCPKQNDMYERIRIPYVDNLVNKFSDSKIVYNSYSTKRLFNDSLSDNEKIYIMQRIGLLKTTMYFANIFGKGCKATDCYNNDIVNFDRFILKVKASLIEMLWNDKCNNNERVPFLKKVLDDYPKQIPEIFFSINRKCRDNIHYGFYNEITEDEIKILYQYQDIYLNYIIKEIEKYLIINFNLEYKISLDLAKLQYWASNKEK